MILAVLFGQRRPRGRALLFVPGGVFLMTGLAVGSPASRPDLILLLGACLGVKAWALFIITLYLPWTEAGVERILG